MGIGLDLFAKDHEEKLEKSGNVLRKKPDDEVFLNSLIDGLLGPSRGKRREKTYTVNLPVFPVDRLR